MPLRSLLLVAGLSALVLAGCGSENDALIPRDDADRLSQLVADAGQASDAGECDTAHRAARQATQQLDGLPRRTSKELKQNLRDWLEHLDETIGDECSAEPEATPTPTPTTTAAPTETPTVEPTPTAEPTETATPEPTETPAPTEEPGTGGEGGPEEPSASGGVPPQEDG